MTLELNKFSYVPMKTISRLLYIIIAVFPYQVSGEEPRYPDEKNRRYILECTDYEIFVNLEYSIDKNGHTINLNLLEHNNIFFVRIAMLELQDTIFEQGAYVVGELYTTAKTYPPITEKCYDVKTKSNRA